MALESEQRGTQIGQFCGGSFRLDSMPFENIDQARLGPEQFQLLLGANINNLSTSGTNLVRVFLRAPAEGRKTHINLSYD